MCVSGQPWPSSVSFPSLCMFLRFAHLPGYCLRPSLSFTCGSEDNNPRTPPHVTPRASSLGNVARFYFYFVHLRTHARTSLPRYILAAPVRRHSLFQDYHASFSCFSSFLPNLLDYPLPSVALGNLAHAQSISAKGFSRTFHPKRPTAAAHRRTTTTDTTTTSKYKPF